MSSIGALFIPELATLRTLEDNLRAVIESVDFHAYTVGLAQLKAYFPTYRHLTGFDSFPAYVEDRFGISPASLKKYVDTGRTIMNNKEALEGVNLPDIRSRSHLNYLNRALSNHTISDVRSALVSMSLREFKEWAKTPDIDMKTKKHSASSTKDPVVPKAQMEDYRSQVKAAFRRNLEVFMIGCRSQEEVERSRKALEDHARSVSISAISGHAESSSSLHSESSESPRPYQTDSMTA